MKKIIFFDIETVYEDPNYEVSAKKDIRAEKYCNDIYTTEQQAYYDKASIHPEFSKIICISYGIGQFIDSITGTEEEILKKFFEVLDGQGDFVLGGHNIKSFDIPFVFRRSIINGIKPHQSFILGSKKPREIEHVDTMDMRKQTGYISSGLDLICRCLDIASPKEDMSGKDVARIYWEVKDKKEVLQRISKYCEADVIASMKIYEKIQNILGTPIEKSEPKSELISEKQVGYAMSLWTKLGEDEEKRKLYLFNRYKVNSIKDLTKFQASEFIDDLNKPNFKEILLDIHTKNGSDGDKKHPLQDDDLPF